jgi:hypothetical protein
MSKRTKLYWTLHTSQLIRELSAQHPPKGPGDPIRVLTLNLMELTERAIHLHDLELLSTLAKLGLLAVSDPSNKDYDAETTLKIINQGEALREARGVKPPDVTFFSHN